MDQQSGDIEFNAQGDITIGGDVVSGDKITTTNITNVHAAASLALNLHQLPPPPRDFTGRAAELDELIAAVEKGNVIIWGTAGVGKTTLALKLAELLVPRYPDAQFYLDLKGVAAGTAGDRPLSPAEAMAHVIHAYYPTTKLPESEAELRGLYHSVLHGKRALLLLDNARDAAQVAPLLPPSGCIALITSRQHFALSGLQSVNLEKLPPDDAKGLIKRIVARLIAEQLANALDEMARLCGYLPLALRASASALQERVDLTPADYVRRLRDENQRLQLEGIKAEGVPISVAASFNLSYQLLTEEQQKLWRALAVFPDSFDRAAAAAVWAMEDEDSTQDALSELVRYSLLDFSPHPSPLPSGGRENLPSPSGRGARGEGELPGRYRLHDLAHLFAHSRLSNDERDAAQKRHAMHYQTVLRSTNELYLRGGDSIRPGLALFDREWPNIQAGQAWAVANTEHNTTAARLCDDYPDTGAYVLGLRQHPREKIRWLEAALAAVRRSKNRQRGGAHLGNLGAAYADLGDARKAIEFCEQALVIDREIGDRRGEGADLGNLGNAYAILGDTHRAIEFHEQALSLHRELGDRRGEGADLGNLGIAYANLGDARKAIEFYEQHLVIAREIGDRRGEGNALGNLGNACLALGDARKAIEFYEQALTIDREIGNRRGEGADLCSLGLAYADLGDARKAIEFYKQALVIGREIGDRRGEGNAFDALGNAYAALGDTRKAIEFYEQALVIDCEIGDRRSEGNALFNTSLALDSLGNRAQAIAHAEAALKIYEQIESPYAERVRKQLAEWERQ